MTSLSTSQFLARSDRSALAEWRRTLDWPLMIAAFALLGVGLVLSLAAGPTEAERLGYARMHFVTKHFIVASFSGALLIAVSILDKQWARRLSGVVFLGAFILMAWILFMGHEAKGAQRWLRVFGFSLQPSEMIKPAVIVLTGWLLAQRKLFPEGPFATVAFVLFAVTIGLLLLQPDVGQTALLTAAFFITFFVSGLPWKWAAGFFGGGSALAGTLYATLPHVRQRVNSFINPAAYDTYQVDKAREAISRGGIPGAGPGEGTIKSSLPDAHTDFIYAVMSEEFGYVAALALMALIAFITLRGIMAAARHDDPYPRAAATGLFALFGLQAVINIGVNVGLLPPKGMTLPFVSSGGSSLIGIALTLGLGLALIRRAGIRMSYRRPYG